MVKYKEISRFLYENWDPLGINGIAPEDEYEVYGKQIAALINAGLGTDHSVAELLKKGRVEMLAIGQHDEVDKHIASAIIEICKDVD